MILTAEKSGEVAERIREAVEGALAARNLSARRASMDVVGHDGLIRDIRAGRIPSADRIEALFDYLGLEAYFGPKREPRSAHLRLVTNMAPEQDAPTGFLTVPWAEGAPGTGSAPICFSRAWLDDQGLKIDFLKAVLPTVVLIEGHSQKNSLVVVDNRPENRKGHGLWCYSRSGLVTVSHVTFGADLTILHPGRMEDSPTILEGPVSHSIEVFGKVVWLGQSLPLKGSIRQYWRGVFDGKPGGRGLSEKRLGDRRILCDDDGRRGIGAQHPAPQGRGTDRGFGHHERQRRAGSLRDKTGPETRRYQEERLFRLTFHNAFTLSFRWRFS